MADFALKGIYMTLSCLLLAFVLALSPCTSHTTYTISPTCPGNGTSNDTQCLTLSDAAMEPDVYFTTNTTLVLHPGDHSLQGALVSVASISGLTIKSLAFLSNSSKPKIIGEESLLSFYNVSNVQILSINFVSCPLSMHSTTGKFDSCSFEGGIANFGGAVTVLNGSSLYFSGETRFSGNIATRGGALFIDSSNLTLSGKTTFFNNTALDAGGGLFIYNHSVVTVKGRLGPCMFHGNSALQSGGAVLAIYDNAVNFDGNITFYDNTAATHGGAMYVTDSNTVSYKGTITFRYNTARDGGALYVHVSNTVNFKGATTLYDNSAVSGSGGAVAADGNNAISFDGTSTFHGNTARFDGGAVAADGNNAISFDGTSTFHGNTARFDGGAVATNDSSTISFSGKSTFHNNVARFGGAVNAVVNNTVYFVGISTFCSNTARFGGAVRVHVNNAMNFNGTSTFHDSRAIDDGSAVYAHSNNTLSFIGSSIFDYNVASYGGTVSAYSSNSVHFSGTSVFHGSTATHGGAVYAGTNNAVNFSGNSTFYNNTATYGGALVAYWSNIVHFSGTNTFHYTSAEYGGAVYASIYNSVGLNGTSTFYTTSASQGGAVFANVNNSVSFSGTNIFYNNTATYGGALVAYSTNIVHFSGTSTFHNITAEYGGAVYSSINNSVALTGTSTFYKTTANKGGAVFALTSNTLSFSGMSSFCSNQATSYGGAVFAKMNNSVHFIGTNIFYNNTATYGGALVAYSSNTVHFSVFHNSIAKYGGAVSAKISDLTGWNETSTFYGNTASHGGAVFAFSGNIVGLSGTITFCSNTATTYGGSVFAQAYNFIGFNGTSAFYDSSARYGGAVIAYSSNTVHFSGNNSFHDTEAYYGSALYAQVKNSISFKGSSTFYNNAATVGPGGAVYAYTSNTLDFSGTSTFCGNAAAAGGALFAQVNNTVGFSGTSTFHNNTAMYGGALSAYFNNTVRFEGSSTFQNNSALFAGGAVSSQTNNTVSFSRNSSFTGNTAELFGGGIYAVHNTNVDMIGNTEFLWNQASYGGGIFVQGGSIVVSAIGGKVNESVRLSANAVLSGNSASESGGAIHAAISRVSLEGRILVTENTAKFGGGLAFSGLENRILFLKPGTQMDLTGNRVESRGGAIHIEDNPFTYCSLEDSVIKNAREPCFFQIIYQEDCILPTGSPELFNYTGGILLNFTNNNAAESGSAVYGGRLQDCGVCYSYENGYYLYQTGKYMLQSFTREQDISELDIASEPFMVCVCEDNVPQCGSRSTDVTMYPGEILSLCVVAVGQMNGTVPSVIRAVAKGLQLTSEYTTQTAENNRNCTEIHYPLVTDNTDQTAMLELYSDEPCSTSGYGYTVSIFILPCPTGFTLSAQGECSCEDRLIKYTQECTISNQTITRLGGSTFWVGVDYNNNTASGLILHPHCPFDYCTVETVYFPLNETDTQCSNRRSGVLCGACQTGYSLALGSSRCIPDCSNLYLTLLLPFAVAGLALVLLLFFCNLTVAEGSISGLIFYANILVINQSVFIPSSDDRIPANLLTVFIAWLNLDLGIEMCFFTSLDIYIRTWLQYAFPLYIWLLVGLIAYFAHISTTTAKVIATTNPVAVLATLFLLSYTKLLRTIMAAFSFTTLSYPDDETKVVWLYDGNIGYWDGKHLVLLLVSLLMFVIIFTPYTLFLLCGQWIHRNIQLQWVPPAKWLHLKYFCDAYNAPYKDRHYYWTGLLLLVRFTVLLLSAIISTNKPQDPYTNLLVLIIIVSTLIAMAWISHGLYKKWYLDVLEASFLINLIVLSAATYQVRLSGGNQAALVYTSISVAFITFIMIAVSAVLQRLRRTRFGRLLCDQINNLHGSNQAVSNQDEPNEKPAERHQAPPVTMSVVEITPKRMLDSTAYRETALDLV